MGILRLTLAAIVLQDHCPDGIIPRLTNSVLAVQCFYVISGFYIQLIILEKYSNGENWKLDFYKSRLFRIFPVYYIFLLLTIILVGPGYIENASLLGGFIYLFNNAFIVGQDILRFFVFDQLNSEFFFRGVRGANSGLTRLGQSWTLALELTFYLIAPFLLLRQNLFIILLLFLTIALRLVFGHYGYNQSGWLYGFFPFELGIFLLGALGCRFYIEILKKKNLIRNWLDHIASLFKKEISDKLFFMVTLVFASALLYCLLTFMALGWNYIPGGTRGGSIAGASNHHWAVIFATALTLPFLFYFTKNIKADRFIGELSYPVYLGHFLILEFVKRADVQTELLVVYVMFISVLISIPIVLFIDRPMTNFRHRKFYSKRS